jgi:hypothetical protein
VQEPATPFTGSGFEKVRNLWRCAALPSRLKPIRNLIDPLQIDWRWIISLAIRLAHIPSPH